ncbi:sulfatase-like hydrolase/transferase [Arthrobacter castelli]|uniref:sulfatase-like hydrolase/transferase n=1 Tax=Arthrobacter castelli TaxID=271431 RepID=UPI00040E5A54|nr:sulfatase-like hydrolase/transferase [Arthrobacter castelli]
MTTTDKPNVLVLMADQFRWDAIAAHGDPAIYTPNLDRLVRSGVSFRNCYTETPVCVPARATMLTGRLGHQTGVLDNQDSLDPCSETFAKALSQAGYRTQAIGKMHFSPPRQHHGLDQMLLSEEIPESPQDDDYLTYLLEGGYGHVKEPHGIRHELYYQPQVSQLPPDRHTTAWTGRQTVEFLRERKSEPEPWLCWTSFIKPHPPFDPPSNWYDRYDPLEMRDPKRAEPELNRLERNVRLQHRFKWTSPDIPTTLIRTMRAYYYASVSFVDHWIGAILDELESSGERSNTLIVFTADHGEYLGDHWAYGKRGFHDSAAKVPMVLSRPGTLPESTEVNSMTGLANLSSTILETAGLPSLGGSSDSLLSAARSDAAASTEPWIGLFGHGDRSIYAAMDGTVKYTYSAGDDREAIYAMDRDEGDLTALLPTDPLFGRGEKLGTGLRERLRTEGFSQALQDDGGWHPYPPTEDFDSPGDDRSVDGRGRQYAIWQQAFDIC